MLKTWLKAAAIRAIKTFAQSFASMITVGAALNELDWGYILSVAAVSAVYSLATSAAGLPEVKAALPEAEDSEGAEDEDLYGNRHCALSGESGFRGGEGGGGASEAEKRRGCR